MSAATDSSPASRVLADADLCVKCGLCLPHCPTYLDAQHEGDGPRGRIALIQGLATGLIGATSRVEAHLDGCLSCRRCEVVCPARVPFSTILDAGRAQLAQLDPARTRLTRLLALLLVPRASRALLRVALKAYGALRVPALLRRWPALIGARMARVASLLPNASAPALPRAAPEHDAGAADRIAVFEGCASSVFEREAIYATRRLLEAADYAVEVPAAQTCCGALHQHAGMPEHAARLAARNLRAFTGHTRIASLTTGCAATLRDYGAMNLGGGAVFAQQVQDFAEWLRPHAAQLRLRPLPLRAALHTPCTALNVMKSDGALRALLARIPRLELIELDATQRCCGAAGSHFVTHPDQADRLLQPKLDALDALRPDLLISANIGCSLHFTGGLNRAGRVLPVLHPAVLLAQQLERPPPRS